MIAAVLFRRANASIANLLGIGLFLLAFVAIADGFAMAAAAWFAAGFILVNQTAQNNGGLWGFTKDVLALLLILTGVGMFG